MKLEFEVINQFQLVNLNKWEVIINQPYTLSCLHCPLRLKLSKKEISSKILIAIKFVWIIGRYCRFSSLLHLEADLRVSYI